MNLYSFLFFSFWPPLDNAIRAAVYRGVHVQLLFSHWNHTRKQTEGYLRSLLTLNEAMEESKFPGRIEIVILYFK